VVKWCRWLLVSPPCKYVTFSCLTNKLLLNYACDFLSARSLRKQDSFSVARRMIMTLFSVRCASRNFMAGKKTMIHGTWCFDWDRL